MRASPDSLSLALALALVLGASSLTSAHRRDEYLQAARVAIEPGRIDLELDLTAGIAVADRVLADLDGNGDGTVAAAEARAYAGRLLRAISLDVDGRRLPLELVDVAPADVTAVRAGEGTLRLQARAAFAALPAGDHALRFRNSHRSDIGAYLANALVPASEDVRIIDQRRDPDQRELVVRYVLRGGMTGVQRALWSSAAAIVLWVAVVWRRRQAAFAARL